MSKRVMVTGGAGFIGSHLCDRLLELGYMVLCVDDLSTGNIDNIEHLLQKKEFQFIKHDITQPIHLDIDQIYNLACPASPIQYQKNPIKTVTTNFVGVKNMLELCKKVGARLLQASTSEIYGNARVHPQAENYRGDVNTVGVRSCYDEGKRVAETLCMDYCRQYGVEVKIIRIFNTYGPRMQIDDGRVVSNFITQLLSKRSITLYGNGTQTRSFCYVDDLIQGMILMMESEEQFHGPVNLGNPEEIKIYSLLEKLTEITGRIPQIEYLPLPEDEPSRRKPDVTLAEKELGWRAHTSLDVGLLKTVEYFREIIK